MILKEARKENGDVAQNYRSRVGALHDVWSYARESGVRSREKSSDLNHQPSSSLEESKLFPSRRRHFPNPLRIAHLEHAARLGHQRFARTARLSHVRWISQGARTQFHVPLVHGAADISRFANHGQISTRFHGRAASLVE